MSQRNVLFSFLRRFPLLCLVVLIHPPIQAQTIVPDGLGTVVESNGNTFQIQGGTTVGRNLFHSFGSFNLVRGETANFVNSNSSITNIFARIRGGGSSIDGTIQSLSVANLFLMNPNGILFGPSARLNVGGSFVATTANAIQFPGNAEFSAQSSVEPGNELLSVNPSAFLFNQIAAASIQNQSIAPAGLVAVRVPGLTLPVPVALTGLRVPDGRNLLLVGGDVFLNGGRLNALQGRVEIAGIAGNGTVGLNLDANNKPFLNSLPDINARANISMNNARINLPFGNAGLGGSVAIAANNLRLNNSNIFSGTVGQENAGDIWLNAKSIALNQSQLITSTVGAGNAGRLSLQAQDTISLTNSSRIINETAQLNPRFPVGNAGTTTLLSGQGILIDQSSISSRTSGAGQGGNIRIDTGGNGSLVLSRGAAINAGTAGTGNAGDINVNANFVNLNQSSLSSAGQLAEGDLGSSGNITIRANSLTLSDRAELFTSNTGRNPAGIIDLRASEQFSLTGNSRLSSETSGQGAGGNLEIEAGRLVIDDSSLFARTSGTGSAGNLNFAITDILNIANNSQLSSETLGLGDGGNITIRAKTLSVVDSFVFAITREFGIRNAGNIQIIVPEAVFVSRFRANAETLDNLRVLSTGLFVSTVGAGSAGNLSIHTDQLQVDGGARISASTSGPGRGGTLAVTAGSIDLTGMAVDGRSPSGLFTETQAAGDAGSLTINASRLLIRDGAQVSASTSGTGRPGSILVQHGDSVSLSNGSISTAVNPGAIVRPGEGEPAGNIAIQTRTLSLNNRAQITASTSGQGDAGNIRIQATDTTSLANSSISTAVNPGAIGQGGNIDIQTGVFSLTDNAQVSASTAGQGTAGSVKVTASTFESSSGGQIRTSTAAGSNAGSINLQILDSVTLAGNRTGLFASTDRGSSGNGGNIWIDPRIVTVRDGAKIAVDSQGTGTGGSIDLQAGRLVLNTGEISAQTASNQGGNINLQLSDLLLLRRNSQISTTAGTAQTGGDGGNIRITAPFVIAVRTENNDITANAFTGSGGRVDITTQGLFGIEPRDRLTPLSDITASSEFGVAGIVTINTPDVDPSRGLTELPSNLIDAASQISQGCIPNRQQSTSSFVITGRGGLPSSPTEPLGNDAVMAEWVTVERSEGQRGRGTEGPRRKDRLTPRTSHHSAGTPNANTPPTIVEAQSWMVDANGQIVLVAQSPASNSRPWLVNGTCEAAKTD